MKRDRPGLLVALGFILFGLVLCGILALSMMGKLHLVRLDFALILFLAALALSLAALVRPPRR